MTDKFQKLGLPAEAVLLLDNAQSHPGTSALSSTDGKIICLFLPPNTTSLIQPVNQGVLENIKSLCRQDLLLKAATEEDSENTTVID